MKMSKHGSENYSFEYRELQATTMSIDRNGFYALLAGRKYLAISNLEKNEIGHIQVRIPYDGKYEISNTQWSHMANPTFGVASSQRCDIFELTDAAELKRIYQLKAHSRVITDLDWSTLSPNLLATSSFDSFLYVWDLRCPRDLSCEKPQVSLSALDGASQVTWNKWKVYYLASCDGGHVKIWDIRKPTTPTEYIAAHAAKINGLEWLSRDTVITAAQDCTAKFSRLAASNPGKIKGPCLTLTTPIWRARPTPFGRGIVTQCVPILRRDSGLLSLWNWQSFTSPIYTFQGHDIIEFAWKKSGICDIVTWSRDQTLRLWSLPREVIELCGEDVPLGNSNKPTVLPTLTEDVSLAEDIQSGPESITPSDSLTLPSSWKSNGKPSPKRESSAERQSRNSPSLGIQREDLLNEEIGSFFLDTSSEHLQFEQVDLDRGLLKFGWKPDPKSRSVSIVVLVSIPINYPSSPPTFVVSSGGHDVDKAKLIKVLRQVAQNCVRKNEPCLRPCINAFTEFMALPVEEPVNPYLFPSRGASNVPFPRTSGARFCSVGVLVCFGRPAYLKRVKSNCDAGTPRSLSALGPFLMQLTEESSMSTPHKSRRKKVEKKRAGLVTLFDVTPLLPLTRELAGQYKHGTTLSSRKSICEENALIAKSHGKQGVSHSWFVCSVISNFTCSYNHSQISLNKIPGTPISDNGALGQIVEHGTNASETIAVDDEDVNWFFYHPLGSELVHNMITHYAKFGDVQTAAAIASQFTISASDEAAGLCHHGFHLSRLTRPAPAQELGGWQNLSRTAHSQSQPWSISIGGPPQPRPVSRGGRRLIVPKGWTKGMGSPYHTVHGSDTMHGVTINPISDNLFRQHRSNSWSDSLDDGVKLLLNTMRVADSPAEEPEGQGSYYGNEILCKTPLRGVILDPKMSRTYDGYKKCYAEILYRWGLLQQRAAVLKCVTERSEEPHVLPSGVDYTTECPICKQAVRGAHCATCKRTTSTCGICHMPANGLCTFCISCGHGGHIAHMSQWYKSSRQMCPTGCGCQCIAENERIFGGELTQNTAIA